ncbi:FAD-dependent oxidoreductase [Rhodococcus sp. HM1]|uniref:NAD(P)/FAD-dependent oxidoreductase n=1 Tax=Rhodococcus sp. HM1 TaxID=2937759 RepID=UPI00200A9C72|nr:FAD-dependent oxidoreductase [Rhodococcus sp. HM1]MCK8673125.1 FAD-dependent oxidoreductase [Rhodococcus sp. HM1]
MASGTVIVGASLAGIRTAQDLRREGYDGPITLVGEEPERPYDRPPLSKGFLSGAVAPQELSLCSDDEIGSAAVELVLGARAVGVDVDRRIVGLADGETIGYDNLVIATGAACIRPPWYREIAGVHELRTLADARALRSTLTAVNSLVVVGGGFVGTEVAATARSMGIDVTMVLREAAPLAPALGDAVAQAVSDLHRGRGVAVHHSSDVAALLGDQAVEGVRLADGTVVAAEAVLVAVGVRPSVQWLAGTPFYDPRGVGVTGSGRAGERVWAAGDVVRSSKGHWAAAIADAKSVAADIAGRSGRSPSIEMPDYFWSDQYSHKVQVLGRVGENATLTPIVGSLESMSFVGVYGTDSAITGALLIDQPRHLGRMRQLVSVGASVATCRAKVA